MRQTRRLFGSLYHITNVTCSISGRVNCAGGVADQAVERAQDKEEEMKAYCIRRRRHSGRAHPSTVANPSKRLLHTHTTSDQISGASTSHPRTGPRSVRPRAMPVALPCLLAAAARSHRPAVASVAAARARRCPARSSGFFFRCEQSPRLGAQRARTVHERLPGIRPGPLPPYI